MLPDDQKDTLDKKVQALRHQEEEQRTRELAKSLGFAYQDVSKFPVESEALLRIDEATARACGAVALRKDGQKLFIASMNPTKKEFLDLLHTLKQQRVEPEVVVASRSGIDQILAMYPRYAHLVKKITGQVEIAHDAIENIRQKVQHVDDVRKLVRSVSVSSATSLVEWLLGSALKLDATDAHIEPHEDGDRAKIRFRLDGVLYDVGEIERRPYELVRSRLKLLSGMKLNIENMGQDGRFSISENGQEIEVRTSTLPGPRGEYIVMRLLKPSALLSIRELGLRDDLIEIFEGELKQPTGMILTTGPTGSGKTTALYAFVTHIATPELKIITIEDPIEYKIQSIEQTQVNAEAGYGFADALKSIMRQDPDIILIGEIRDKDTAEIAMHASLTGHLVFSTLHTNDAAGAVPRLIDLGVKPTVIAPAINVILSQRLVRRLCAVCAENYSPEEKEFSRIHRALALLPAHLKFSLTKDVELRRAGKGCAQCHFSGYKGLIGIFELFRIDADVETLILSNPSFEALEKEARRAGMVPMMLDGILRVIQRVTSLEELERVCGSLEEVRK